MPKVRIYLELPELAFLLTIVKGRSIKRILICWKTDGVIGIGITATAVGLIAGGIAAALARRN